MRPFGPVRFDLSEPIAPVMDAVIASISQLSPEARVAMDLRRIADLLDRGAFVVVRYEHVGAPRPNSQSADVHLTYSVRPRCDRDDEL